MRNHHYHKQSKLSIWLQTFYYIAHFGSFTKASKKLNQSRSTLTNHIFELESMYSVRLINRTTRSFSLSQEGEAVFEQCKKMNEVILKSHAMLSTFSTNNEGQLRVKIPSVLDTENFHAILSLYKKAHSQVMLDVIVDNELGDLVGEKVDIALHLGDLADSSYICRKLMHLNTYVVSSPEFWKKHPKPNHPNDLIDLPCINYRHCRTGNKWSFIENNEKFLVDICTTHICHSDQMLMSFALDGSGLATLLDFTCKEKIDSGELETCLENWTHQVPLYAIIQKRENLPVRVRIFVDFLVEMSASL
jgi:DNA-binding transcriptional LysR family regulator